MGMFRGLLKLQMSDFSSKRKEHEIYAHVRFICDLKSFIKQKFRIGQKGFLLCG